MPRPFLILPALLVLAACSQTSGAGTRPVVTTPVGLVAGSSFSETADGTVIPDDRPDAETVAFAARCGGRGGGGGVSLGMSECDLIGLKGTPSRVVAGIDIEGRSQNAVWYVENGRRTVYKFTDDKLIAVLN
jgi:hypothetical protein